MASFLEQSSDPVRRFASKQTRQHLLAGRGRARGQESCDAADAPGDRQVPPPGGLERERAQFPGIRQPFGTELPATAGARSAQQPSSASSIIASIRARAWRLKLDGGRRLQRCTRHPPQVSGTWTVLAMSPARMLQLKSPTEPHVASEVPMHRKASAGSRAG